MKKGLDGCDIVMMLRLQKMKECKDRFFRQKNIMNFLD